MVLIDAEPPMRDSVLLAKPGLWFLGPEIICEELGSDAQIQQDTISFWKDGPSTFTLRKRSKDDVTVSPKAQIPTAPGQIYDAGGASAVWLLGNNAICKVRYWLPGMALEAETIAFVKTVAPSIPVPNVIYSWVDEAQNRTYLIEEKVSGMTLVEAWPSLSEVQRTDVAKQITTYTVELATITSSRFESATGTALEEYNYAEDIKFEPIMTAQPHLIGPFGAAEYAQYLRQLAPSAEPLEVGSVFHFYHNDTGPTNIMVELEQGYARISALIDWERAGYFPRFVIGTRPRISTGYILGDDESWVHDDRTAWSRVLSPMLEEAGYKSDVDGYLAWLEGKNELGETALVSKNGTV